MAYSRKEAEVNHILQLPLTLYRQSLQVSYEYQLLYTINELTCICISSISNEEKSPICLKMKLQETNGNYILSYRLHHSYFSTTLTLF